MQSSACRYLVQEFVVGRENSIGFERNPGETLSIASAIERTKVRVHGDGKSTLGALAAPHLSARQYRAASAYSRDQWDAILPKNREHLVTLVGTHSMGAKFLRVRPGHWAFEDIRDRLENLDGLNYCRVDIIVSQNAERYWVLELNGANAEPLVAYEEPIDDAMFYACFKCSISRRLAIGCAVARTSGYLPKRSELAFALISGVRRYLLS